MIPAWPKRIEFGHGGRRSEMAAKRASDKAKSEHVFGQSRETGENVPRRPVCPRFYQRSTDPSDESRAMREYAARRGWTVAMQFCAERTPERRSETLARNCWRLHAAGRSMWARSGD